MSDVDAAGTRSGLLVLLLRLNAAADRSCRYIYGTLFYDDESNELMYQSTEGWILLALRMLIMVWFIHCVFRTIKQEPHPQKKCLYRTFGALFTLWFCSLPGVVILSYAVDPWYRAKVMDRGVNRLFRGVNRLFWTRGTAQR